MVVRCCQILWLRMPHACGVHVERAPSLPVRKYVKFYVRQNVKMNVVEDQLVVAHKVCCMSSFVLFHGFNGLGRCQFATEMVVVCGFEGFMLMLTDCCGFCMSFLTVNVVETGDLS